MGTYNNLKPVEPPKEVINFRQLVYSNADCYGDKALYIYKENGETVKKTYNEFLNDVRNFSTALYSRGLAGKSIAVTGDTHPAWMVAFLAVICTGGIIVPLDRELDVDQAIEFMKIANCSALVYTSGMNKKIEGAIDKMAFLDALIPVDSEYAGDKVIPFQVMCAEGAFAVESGDTSFDDHRFDMDAVSAILFTSGTTGSSKGVMLSHGNFVAAVNASADAMQYDRDDTLVSVLPIHHTYELTCGQLTASNLGMTTYISDGLRYVTRNFKEFKPTALVLVPLFLETVYKKIWQELDRKKMTNKVRAAMKMSDGLLKMGIDIRPRLFHDITAAFGGNLKSIVVGGAPIDPKIIRDFYSFGITVLQGYGITECAPLVAVNRAGHVKFTSVGKPVLNCQVKIEPLPESTDDDVEGEILVKGPNVMKGYYQNEEATSAVFTEDGWFRTGDVGFMDKKGYITITGRLKNVIIASNGKNVFPEELEERLNRLSAVRECVVVGREEESGEVVITAVIVPDYGVLGEGTTDTAVSFILKEAIAQINRTLPPYKHINRFELRHEDFEKTLTKKIKRFLVK